MVRVAITLLILVTGWWAHAAQIIATVDRNVVGVNEAIRLSFEADGETGTPDFSPLREHFEILDRSQSQNLSIVNGQTSRTLVWDLVLMATQAGEYQIPAIRFGKDSSQPISITVKPQGTIKQEERTIYLKVEVDTKQPYIQQQIVFTVKLFRAVEVASATLSELEVEGVDAIVERFGEDNDYQIVQNGRRWRVVERRYIVFAQQSGYMTIRPLRFKGNIVPRQSSLGFGIFNQSRSKPVVLQSESVTLQVREPPASFAGAWLPAKSITMEESWPAVDSVRVGDPITRSITVSALGLTAAQLPELNPELPPGLRGYPEQPKLQNTGTSEGVLGVRTETAAIIPTQPGPLTLPEIELSWWNLDKQQPELETIPARVVEVLPAAEARQESEPQEPSAATAGEPEETQVPAPQTATAGAASWWPWVSLGLALVWLVTVVLWAVERRRGGAVEKGQGAPSVPPSINRKQAIAALKTAIDERSPAGARDALLHWGQALWPDQPPRNLGELSIRCGDPVAVAVARLERVLYAGETQWDPAGLMKNIVGFKPTQRADVKPADGLEPLFRI